MAAMVFFNMGYEWVEITLTLANFGSFGASIVKKTRFGKTIPSPIFFLLISSRDTAVPCPYFSLHAKSHPKG
jgi:hypothetical protein